MPRRPLIADLPAERFAFLKRPFTNCGVDSFGSMMVMIGRRKEKRYGVIFTCLTTRAVQVEITASLSASSFILALRRMAARRGWRARIKYDNGTNFRGADAELRARYQGWLPILKEYGATKSVDWSFIPPVAPQLGGAWEQLVHSIKVALHATLQEQSPQEEVLQMLLAEAEHEINGYPLMHVSVDAAHPETLTLNHFLFLKGIPTDIITRGASVTDELEIKIGDLVIIVDPQMPRIVWLRRKVV